MCAACCCGAAIPCQCPTECWQSTCQTLLIRLASRLSWLFGNASIVGCLRSAGWSPQVPLVCGAAHGSLRACSCCQVCMESSVCCRLRSSTLVRIAHNHHTMAPQSMVVACCCHHCAKHTPCRNSEVTIKLPGDTGRHLLHGCTTVVGDCWAACSRVVAWSTMPVLL